MYSHRMVLYFEIAFTFSFAIGTGITMMFLESTYHDFDESQHTLDISNISQYETARLPYLKQAGQK